MWVGGIWKISVLSAQFCREPKTAINKNKEMLYPAALLLITKGEQVLTL